MKSYVFTTLAVSLCLLTVPSWAMDRWSDSDHKERLNKATRLPVAAPAVAIESHNSMQVADCDSCDSESDADKSKDKKSRTFFVYIANSSVAHDYAEIVMKYRFSVKERNRKWAESKVHVESMLDGSKHIKKLCKTMKKALKEFEATQELIRDWDQDRRYTIKFTTKEKQPAKAVARYCKKSVLVSKVFSNEADWNRFKAEEEARFKAMPRYGE